MSYFNTCNESGQPLLQFRAKADAQGAIVLAYFEDRPCQLFTPSEIWQLTGLEARGVPIHSIRARITSFEKQGKLVKSSVMRKGSWGRSEHCWYYPGEMKVAA